METESSSLMDKFGKPVKNVSPLMKEFRDFAMRGNVIDLAVGVVIGAAFGKIVDALVTNVIMPPIGLLTGGIDLSDRAWILADAGKYADVAAARAAKPPPPMINYGAFLNSILSFLIVSFTIFICIRLINKIYPKPATPVTTKDCPFCCSAIPLAATRCPQCTSMLDGSKAPATA
jgi:large conductance mechanosensitive channel